MSRLVEGLMINGELIIVAASADPLTVNPVALIASRRSIRGWPLWNGSRFGRDYGFLEANGHSRHD
jgi:hypothetical protein